MKNYFPNTNRTVPYFQSNRSDRLGSIWSSFNIDLQSNLGALRLSAKLVTNVDSTTESAMKTPVAFAVYSGVYYAITGADTNNGVIMNTTSNGDITTVFTKDLTGMSVGSSSTRFDVTNPSGTTFRYTYDGTGTNPNITSTSFPIGATVNIVSTNMATGNEGAFTITNSGVNFFEVTNASGVVEADKTISTGYVSIAGGTISDIFTRGSDVATFDDWIYATSSTTLWRKNDTDEAWVSFDTLSSGENHQMAYFKKFDRLYYVSDGTIIKSVATDDTIADTTDPYAIDIGNENENGYISCITVSSGSVWIGTKRRLNSSESDETYGAIYEWDGISSQVTNEYKLNAGGCLALTEHGGIIYAIDTEGRILKQDGYSFSEIARFPLDRYLLRSMLSNAENAFVHFNGFVGTKNNTLLINIANAFYRSSPISPENLQGGIWELDLSSGNLTHKYAPSYKQMTSSTITDFGQSLVRYSGAIMIDTYNQDSTNYNNGKSRIVTGFGYYKDATTTGYGIFVDSPAKPLSTDYEGQKRGYIIPTWFSAEEIEDRFTRIWTTYKRFSTSTDKIIFKYRLEEEAPVEATITWVNTTSFTTTTDVSAYDKDATGFNGVYGGEAEIIQGTGAGACPTILDVTNNAGTYTVTLNEAVTGVTTGTAKARFQKWIRVDDNVDYTHGSVLSYKSMSIDAQNTRIQIKICFEWTGDGEFHKFILASNPTIQATP